MPPAKIDISTAPDQRKYDAGDPELRAAANALQRALNGTTAEEEERLWTELIGAQTSPLHDCLFAFGSEVYITCLR